MTSTLPSSLAHVAPAPEVGAERSAPTSTYLLNWGVGIIGAVVIGLFFYGLVALIPFLGDIVLLGIGLPAVISSEY